MGRTALDRLVLRAPRLGEMMASRLAKLPPDSEQRKRMLDRFLTGAFAAVNRGDLDTVLIGYEPDIEVWTSGMEATGLRECYRGHDGIREMFAELDSVFSEWGWEVSEVVDRGDRVAVRIDFSSRGRGSGVETTQRDLGSAYRLSPRGKCYRQDFFMRDGWKQALEAVEQAQ